MIAAAVVFPMDAPMALYLTWVAFSVALAVVAVIWVFRPAVGAPPLKRLGLVWFVLTIALLLVTTRIFRRSPHRPSIALALATAPDFSFRTVDGQSFSRESLHGKVVFMEFWASWCVPCREALPEMFRFYNQFKNPRFVMIGISEDEDQNKFEDFVAQEGIRWPQDWDPGGNLATRFSAHAIPSYAVIDANGQLRFLQQGFTRDTFMRIQQSIQDSLAAGGRVADARP